MKEVRFSKAPWLARFKYFKNSNITHRFLFRAFGSFYYRCGTTGGIMVTDQDTHIFLVPKKQNTCKPQD